MWPVLILTSALAAPTREEVDAALATVNGRAPATGYVFFLDTSAPMKATADGLRAEIAALAGVIPAGDSLEVLAFHTRPYVALPRTVVTDAGRAALVAQLTTLELPSSYDRDLGAGLAALATELVAEGAPAFQHVFAISTFCHAPPVMSPWSAGGRGCGPIRDQAKIGARVAAVRDAGGLSAHWFPMRVSDTETDLSGAAAAMHELGGELVNDAAAGWLQNFRARLPATRPAPAALVDSRNVGFTVSVETPPDASGRAVLRLHNSARVLELDLDNVVVAGGTREGDSALHLAPDATLPVQVNAPQAPWSLFPRHDNVDVNLTVTANGHLGPAAALPQWGIEAKGHDLSASVLVPVERRYGLPLPAAIAVLLGAFGGSAFFAVFLRGKQLPLRLGGEIAARHRGGPRQTLPVSERREAALVLGEDGVARVGTAEEATIILRVRRPWWNLYAEVQIRAKAGEINGRPVEPGVHSAIPGATSIRVGDWRVSWE